MRDGQRSTSRATSAKRVTLALRSVISLSYGRASAICMIAAAHRKTLSYGSAKPAQRYRTLQVQWINSNQFLDAQEQDVLDVRKKFGNKYDSGIRQMRNYTL